MVWKYNLNLSFLVMKFIVAVIKYQWTFFFFWKEFKNSAPKIENMAARQKSKKFGPADDRTFVFTICSGYCSKQTVVELVKSRLTYAVLRFNESNRFRENVSGVGSSLALLRRWDENDFQGRYCFTRVETLRGPSVNANKRRRILLTVEGNFPKKNEADLFFLLKIKIYLPKNTLGFQIFIEEK